MDILSYNKVELAPCHPPKYWAKQKERVIHCYIMLDGTLVIDAQFSDGKTMWFSNETKASDIDINKNIFSLIFDTMNEPASTWYAADNKEVRLASKLSLDKLEKAAYVYANFLEEKFKDFSDEWHTYSTLTSSILANQISVLYLKGRDAGIKMMPLVDQLAKELYSFNKEGNWHYDYGKIKPVINDIRKMAYLKLSPEADIRDKYSAMLDYSYRLYNEYMSKVR